MIQEWINANQSFLLSLSVGLVMLTAGIIYLKYFAKPVPARAVDIWEDQAYNDYMDIVQMIVGAMTPGYLDKITIKIENFENHYQGLIPLNIVHQYVVNLYGLVDSKADELNSVQVNWY